MNSTLIPHPASFRDPAGYVFRHESVLYRFIGESYRASWQALEESHLLDELISRGLLVSHKKATWAAPGACALIQPTEIPFITYPHEWCFSQLKCAALLTLEIQSLALDKGFTLKDASAFNVQFVGCKPIFIDTLSFEKYVADQPWSAYRQFCQHFLAPLALMAHTDLRLAGLSRNFIDGVPLDLASTLLPSLTKLNPGILAHIHMHAKFQNKYASDQSKGGEFRSNASHLSLNGLRGIIDSLQSTISKLKLSKVQTEWGDYYNAHNYNEAAFKEKIQTIKEMGDIVQPSKVWDLGANRGIFSRIFSDQKIPTMAWDIDPVAVEKNFVEGSASSESFLLPAVIDLTNPTSNYGWAEEERGGFVQRSSVDLVMALALVHHLAISNNLPLEKVAQFFARIGKHLIIEFVPKEDSQVKILLSSRPDIFPDYHVDGFENAFSKSFKMLKKIPVQGSQRTLYLYEGLEHR